MFTTKLDPLTQQIVSGTLRNLTNGFLTERRSRGLSPRTIEFYKDELKYFTEYMDTQGIVMLNEITPDAIRHYLLALSQRRNSGGCHAAFRAIRAYLNWIWDEFDLTVNNPIKKVRPPENRKPPSPGISIENVEKMIQECRTHLGQRDKALLMFLVDTGVRRAELLALNYGELDIFSGTMTIRKGKGGKSRMAYVGKRTLKELRKYLKTRPELDTSSPLFTTDEFDRLTNSGLRQIIRRRAVDANIPTPGLHDFRRCFALQCLRNGMDLITLSRLLGHSSVVVTQRYVCQNNDDFETAHRMASPVDRWGL